MKAQIPKEPGLKFQNSCLKHFLHFFFSIKIEIANGLMLIEMPKLLQYNFKCYIFTI